ncbi:MAG: hypothetical protein IJH39_03990 [Clostridia bacterium]|nr:hypothetical protein [Clostridia bacterium]
MKEIWIPAKYVKFDGTVIDFTGLYEVSNLGNVKSLERTKSNRHKQIPVNECVLRQYINKSGYYTVYLRKNCYPYSIIVSRLVLSTFKEREWFKDAECNHINENILDNRIENLEWLSGSDNNHFGTRLARAVKKLTNRIDQSKQVIQYDLEGNYINTYCSLAEASRQTGIKSSGICCCLKGKVKSAGRFLWKYKEGA